MLASYMMEALRKKDTWFLFLIGGLIWSTINAISGYVEAPASYKLVFDVQSRQSLDKRYLQVFYDTGAGYNEGDSAVRRLTDAGGQVKTLAFDIPPDAHGNVRLDPLDKGGFTLTLSDMRIVSPSGREVAWVNLQKLQPIGGGIEARAGERRMDLDIRQESKDPMLLANLDASIWTAARSNGAARAVRGFIVSLATYVIAVALAWALIACVAKITAPDRRLLLVFLGLCVAGFAILLLRSPDAVRSPIIYTEDGVWLSSLMTRGFFYTMYHARQDYLVWGNVLLLKLSSCLNYMFNGDSVRYLPLFVASVSYAFYAVVFAVAYLALAPSLGCWTGLLVWLLMLLVPLGHSANEVYGRLSNVGYVVPVLVLCLSILRKKIHVRRLFFMIAFVDVLLLICAATNPLVIPIVGLVWALDLLATVVRSPGPGWKTKAWLVLLLVQLSGLAVFTAYRIHHYGTQVLGENLILENFVAAFVGRMFVYPIFFPFYDHFSDGIALSIFAAGLVVYLWAVMVAEADLKRLLLVFGLGLAFYAVSTAVMRPGITHVITSYSETFPDRYYMGQSLLLLIIVGIATRFFASSGYRPLAVAIVSTVCSLYLIGLAHLIEVGQPRLPLMTGLNFQDQVRHEWRACQLDPICRAEGREITVPTYFEGWSMVLPRYVAEATANDLD